MPLPYLSTLFFLKSILAGSNYISPDLKRIDVMGQSEPVLGSNAGFYLLLPGRSGKITCFTVSVLFCFLSVDVLIWKVGLLTPASKVCIIWNVRGCRCQKPTSMDPKCKGGMEGMLLE